jgi:hypothetical protein
LQGTERNWKEVFGNGASLFTGALLGEPEGVEEGSGDGHLFQWEPRCGIWKRVHLPGTLRDGLKGLWKWNVSFSKEAL